MCVSGILDFKLSIFPASYIGMIKELEEPRGLTHSRKGLSGSHQHDPSGLGNGGVGGVLGLVW